MAEKTQFKVKHDQLYANICFCDLWRMQSAIHIMDFQPLHGFTVQSVNVFFIIKSGVSFLTTRKVRTLHPNGHRLTHTNTQIYDGLACPQLLKR